MEQKPDIIEGVRLLSKHLPDVEFQGLLFIYYEPDLADDDDIKTAVFGTYRSPELSAIITMAMESDPKFRETMVNAVETFKNMAHG